MSIRPTTVAWPGAWPLPPSLPASSARAALLAGESVANVVNEEETPSCSA